MKGNFHKLISGNKPVLVDFHATWCGPCKTLSPIIRALSKDVGHKVRIIKIDIDKNKQLAHKYKIRSVPTLVIFKHNKIVWQASGMKTKAQLIKIVDSYT